MTVIMNSVILNYYQRNTMRKIFLHNSRVRMLYSHHTHPLYCKGRINRVSEAITSMAHIIYLCLLLNPSAIRRRALSYLSLSITLTLCLRFLPVKGELVLAACSLVRLWDFIKCLEPTLIVTDNKQIKLN